MIVSSMGLAFSAILKTFPSLSMKNMSSGISVSFIHIMTVFGCGKTKSCPRLRQETCDSSGHRALRGGGRYLHLEIMKLAVVTVIFSELTGRSRQERERSERKQNERADRRSNSTDDRRETHQCDRAGGAGTSGCISAAIRPFFPVTETDQDRLSGTQLGHAEAAKGLHVDEDIFRALHPASESQNPWCG